MKKSMKILKSINDRLRSVVDGGALESGQKEAVLKALGRGLAFGLDRLRFELDGNDPRALADIAAEAGAVAEWQVTRFDAGHDHAGALAWRGPPLRVRALRATLA